MTPKLHLGNEPRSLGIGRLAVELSSLANQAAQSAEFQALANHAQHAQVLHQPSENTAQITNGVGARTTIDRGWGGGQGAHEFPCRGV